MPNRDLEQAIAHALEPWTNQGRLELCALCGATRHNLTDHVCQSRALDMPGVERDDKKRAKSYAID